MKRTSICKPGMSREYRQLWRIVDGAVRDAFEHHPDYLTAKGRRSAVGSVNKRVVGALHGYVASSAAQRRSGASPAAATGIGQRKAGVFQRMLLFWKAWGVGKAPHAPADAKGAQQ